jgi:abequosyltransferase
MPIKLSFCIPTYQRRALLEETVNSILSQRQEGVEIVIVDNHSTDGTSEYVEMLQKQYPDVIYFRWDQPVACGQNLLKTVELAQGQYCWLMTDDDRVEEGGVKHVLSLLKLFPSLTGLSVNVQGYDPSLKTKKKIRYSHTMKMAKLFTNAEELFQQLGAWLGFWSAHIIDRRKWEEAVSRHEHEPFLGYHHLYLLLTMAKQHPQWFFTDRKCVGYRSNNESFVEEYGRVKRFEIDAFSYTTIGSALFTQASVKKVNRLVLNQLLFWQLVTIKCEKHPLQILREILKIAFHYYKRYGSFWYKFCPLFFCPRLVLRSIRAVKRVLC